LSFVYVITSSCNFFKKKHQAVIIKVLFLYLPSFFVYKITSIKITNFFYLSSSILGFIQRIRNLNSQS